MTNFTIWRSLVDGEEIRAIPDTEADQKLAHRWLLDDVNGTVKDSIGDADGTNNGVASAPGDWVGESAGDGNGIDDHIETTTWADFGSNMGSDFAVAFSVQNPENSSSYFLGVENDGDETIFGVLFDARVDGAPELRFDDSEGNTVRAPADIDIRDEGPYRIVFNKTGDSANDVDCWVNQNGVQITNSFDQGISAPFSDFDSNLTLFAQNRGGSVGDHVESVIDDICIFEDSLSQSEVESYQNPWN